MDRRDTLRLLGSVSLLGALPLVSGPAAGAAPLVRMAFFDNFWPFSRREDDGTPHGKMRGALIDAVDKVAQRANVSVTHAGFPWIRAQKMVEQGELDAFCTLRTEPRLRYAEFCETPFISVPYGVYHRRDDKRIATLQTINDLRKLRQGIYHGSGYAREHLKFAPAFTDDSEDSVLRRIALGEIDIMVSGEFTGTAKVRELGLQDQLTFTTLPFLPRADYRFGLRRSYPNAPAILAHMEHAAQSLRKSGALNTLLFNYRATLTHP
jgi:polar amino acid transport system substrate-binding protein